MIFQTTSIKAYSINHNSTGYVIWRTFLKRRLLEDLGSSGAEVLQGRAVPEERVLPWSLFQPVGGPLTAFGAFWQAPEYSPMDVHEETESDSAEVRWGLEGAPRLR